MGFEWGESGTPFNMAMLYYQEFHNLREKKQEAMLYNNLPLVYDCIEEMFTMIYFKLNKDERKAIQLKLNTLRITIPQFQVPHNVMEQSLLRFKDLMRDVDRNIGIKMNKYHMIFPNINVTGGLKKLQEKYKIGDNNGNKN